MPQHSLVYDKCAPIKYHSNRMFQKQMTQHKLTGTTYRFSQPFTENLPHKAWPDFIEKNNQCILFIRSRHYVTFLLHSYINTFLNKHNIPSLIDNAGFFYVTCIFVLILRALTYPMTQSTQY